jgi:hypothetical protein
MLSALLSVWRSYSACLVRQQIHKRPQKNVPFVLILFFSQATPVYNVKIILLSHTFGRYRPNWLTSFWTQLTCPFNPWTPAPLAAAAQPGEGEPTATPQHAGSIWTLTRYDTIIPGGAFLTSHAAIYANVRIARSRFRGWSPYCQESNQAGICPCA